MKFFRTYGLQIISIILFIAIGLVNVIKDDSNNMYYEQLCEPLQTGWVVDVGTQEKHYDVLPQYIVTDGVNEVILRRKIDAVDNFDAVGFFSFQQQVYVYLDDVEIMRFVPEDGVHSKTPGNGWKFVHLTNEDADKVLSIRIIQCYSKNKVIIPVFYQGTSSGISLSYLKSKLPAFLLSMMEVLVGFIILLLWAVSGKNLQLREGLPWLASFAVFIGLWSGIETNIYSLFFNELLFFSWFSYACLKMAVAAFIMFINLTFHKGSSKVLRVLAFVSMGEFWVSSVLQFFGIIDFAYTVFITHLTMMILGLFVIVNFFHKLVFYRKKDAFMVDRKRTFMAHIMFIMVITCASLVDLYAYYFSNSPDITRFSRLGYASYIFTVTMASLFDFMHLVTMGQQAALIKKEATMDIMTKLRNRASFEQDLDELSEKNCKKIGVLVFDLNNLKLFNDAYGHDMGDYYIIVASEVIQDSFSKWGRIYRIGGDEFCGIVKELTEAEFEDIKIEMEARIEQLHIPNYDLHMAIASGFAVYDADKDNSLRDTMKRADVNMYDRKMQLKEMSGESVR